MSAKPIAPDSGLLQLQEAGFEVETHQQHLLVHSIPYVTAERTIARGTIVCKYMQSGDAIIPPNSASDNHQVWWTGSFPCRSDGTPLTELVASTLEAPFSPFTGCDTKFQFSNKPEELMQSGFPNHYEKVTHYIALIESQARALDSTATAQTGVRRIGANEDSVFRYPDTASVRAEIVVATNRFKNKRIAIVGLGGTGSYILDQVAKTPVAEIHLFDGDEFKQHNAFRAPGAADWNDIQNAMKKVAYFLQAYDPMRKGIVPHTYFIEQENVSELDGFDFVFVCVDRGLARRTLCTYLRSRAIPFIDVGMDVVMDEETNALDATCRVTVGTPQKHDHLSSCLPMDDDDADALYRKNIQIADLNALNAQLAVIKWKQVFGFYEDSFGAHQITYTVANSSSTRTELHQTSASL